MANLDPVIADSLIMPGVKHGFFGRQGGVSSGIYASLNAGKGSSDVAAHVRQNRARIAARMSVADEHLLGVYQIHSPTAVYVDDPHKEQPPHADALVTATPGLALSIVTADCAPILLVDHQAGLIGAAHAGWRGALDGITDAVIDLMIAKGAHGPHIRAAIGPCIAQLNYQVGPEFAAKFIANDPANARFFAPGTADRQYFDLKGYCARRLTTRGLHAVQTLPHDTYAQENDFFSYRRATHRGESDYGRNISVIVLQENAAPPH